jgi:hypothetical protein
MDQVKCNNCGWTGDEDDLVIFEEDGKSRLKARVAVVVRMVIICQYLEQSAKQMLA